MRFSSGIILFLLLAISAEAQLQYKGSAQQKRLFLEGNSLMNWSINHGVINGRYVSQGIYNSVRSGRTIAVIDYGTSSQNQQEINAAMSTRLTPYLKYGDVVFIWEGTNDMYTNAVSGTTAYANLTTYINNIRSAVAGVKIIVATVIARDYVSDRADLMTDIATYNTLIRSNSAGADAICDLAALSQFDARADCTNTTYYFSDKLHIVQGGQDLVISTASTSIATILSQ